MTTATNGPGDAGCYLCPRCDERVPLVELVDHVEGHAAHLSTSDDEDEQ